MGKLKFHAEQFRQAALKFIPVATAQRLSTDTAESSSGGFSAADWGDDELGQSFAAGYEPIRDQVIKHGGDNATALNMFKDAFVDAHDGYVTTDKDNDGKFTGIRNDQVNELDQTWDIGADGTLPATPTGSTAKTTDDVAEQLNEINELEESSERDWKRDNQ